MDRESLLKAPLAAALTYLAAREGSPEAAAFVAGSVELAPHAISQLIQAFSERRNGRVARVLRLSAARAGVSPDEFVARLIEDDELLDILYSALSIAADAASEKKLDALAESIATADENREAITEERLFLAAVRSLEEWHVEALLSIRQAYYRGSDYRVEYLANDLGITPGAAASIVMTLQQAGCAFIGQIRASDELADILGGGSGSNHYADFEKYPVSPTPFGQAILKRFGHPPFEEEQG